MSSQDNGKTTAILSYLTIIGWLVAYFAMHRDQRTSLGSYHLRQTLLLYLCGLVYQVAMSILSSIFSPGLMSIYNLLALGFLVLWIIGLIGAINGDEKPIPLIGDRAQSMFHNI